MSSRYLKQFYKTKITPILNKYVTELQKEVRKSGTTRKSLDTTAPHVLEIDDEAIARGIAPELNAVYDGLKELWEEAGIAGQEAKARALVEELIETYRKTIISNMDKGLDTVKVSTVRAAQNYIAKVMREGASQKGKIPTLYIVNPPTYIVFSPDKQNFYGKIQSAISVAATAMGKELETRLKEIASETNARKSNGRLAEQTARSIEARLAAKVGRRYDEAEVKETFRKQLISSHEESGIKVDSKIINSLVENGWRDLQEFTNRLFSVGQLSATPNTLRTDVKYSIKSVSSLQAGHQIKTAFGPEGGYTPLSAAGDVLNEAVLNRDNLTKLKAEIKRTIKEELDSLDKKKEAFKRGEIEKFSNLIRGNIGNVSNTFLKNSPAAKVFAEDLRLALLEAENNAAGSLSFDTKHSVESASFVDRSKVYKSLKGRVILIAESSSINLGKNEKALLGRAVTKFSDVITEVLQENAGNLITSDPYDEMVGRHLDMIFMPKGRKPANYRASSRMEIAEKLVEKFDRQQSAKPRFRYKNGSFSYVPGSGPKPKVRLKATTSDFAKKLPTVRSTTVSKPRLRVSSAKPLANLDLVKAILAAKLIDKIKERMVKPRLVWRSGRFANSVEVVRATQGATGMLSFYYTYMLSPYQTFEPGFKQGNYSRNPKKLISESIREIVTPLVKEKFRSVRV